jgi:zinc/manganese transport system substrate-binding protein
MKYIPLATATLLLASVPTNAAELPIPILAAQNFYGEVAAAIGGDRVMVESVPMSADADPHDFEPSPSVARAVADAAIVVFNGADYDHWMEHLLESTERPQRTAIEAASLIGVGEGDNPHVWYDPRTMPAVAGAIAEALAALDPDGAKEYESRGQAFVGTLAPIDDKVAAIKSRFAGTPITATEPVFGYMADANGLEMTNEGFQTAIMNETEPSAREIAGIIDDLSNRRVKVLVYNSQVADAMTKQLLDAANRANVPVVGVTETVPDGMGYADWMLGQLDALEKALAGPSS